MWAVMMDHNILIALVSSLLMLILGPMIIDVISVSKKIGRFLSTVARFLAHDDTVVDPVIPDENPPPVQPTGGGLTCRDAATVMARLGVAGWRCVETAGCQGWCDMTSVVDELMDDKRASVRELEEAFYVFDRNEDGFICAAELWNVMRRLGFRQGARYEDCTRMIAAFDDDADGKISFLEFTRMMENAF